jgi:SAM-dependent methyltransferase
VAGLEDHHFWFSGRNRLVRLLLTRHDAAEPIVDLGAGTGAFAAELAAGGRHSIALDHEVPARHAASGNALVADAQRIPLRARTVGTVLARDVLEHVDDAATLAECHRVLRPGGLLIVLVPGWPSLWSERDTRAGHLRRYRRTQLRAALRTAGFDVQEVRGYQFLALPIVVTSRLLSRALGPRVLDREEAPSSRVNDALRTLNEREAGLARWRLPLPPTGSTLVAVARRP